MIPKIIHYCWISNNENIELPKIVKECIISWKNILPDYEIKKWDQNNFDIKKVTFTKEAFENKKYAFVSDYIRLYALYKYGGIYLDTDVKVLKSLDGILSNKLVLGFEDKQTIATCLIASEPKNPIIGELLKLYNAKSFVKKNGDLDMTPNTILMTNILKKYNIKIDGTLQEREGLKVYPIEYFCPMNGYTGECHITSNSYAIHLFNGSWLDPKKQIRLNLYKKYYNRYNKYLPSYIANILSKIKASIEVEGIKGFFYRVYKKIKKF